MAHQTNVHIVQQVFQPGSTSEKVVDPICGKELERHDSKNMVFRDERTVYFCSQTCEEEFLDPAYKRRHPEEA